MIWEIDEASHRVEGLDENGRAVPEYAASLGLVPAPFGRRALAAGIELAVYVVLQLPLLLGALPGLLEIAAAPGDLPGGGELALIVICAAASSVLTTAFVLTQLVLQGRRGVTLGKGIAGIRSVNVRTLERPGFWRGAVVRALVLWASFAVPLIGPLLVVAFSPFFDAERRGRGWADLAAATWFVDARAGLNPYDAKRMRIARKTAATDLADVRSELPSLATPADERAGTAYIPTSRSSGGVLGASRDAHGSDVVAPAAGPAAPAAAPATVPAAAPASVPAAAPATVPAAAPSSATRGAWVPPRLLPDAAPEAPAAVPAQPAAAAPDAAAPTAASSARRAAGGTAAAAIAPGATLALDSGEVIEIRGSGILLGRDPAPSPGDPRLVPVAIADPSMSVSKTHLAVIRAGAGLVAIDLGSTNGSAIVRAGVEHSLTAREQVALRDDDTIRLGDRHARLRIG